MIAKSAAEEMLMLIAAKAPALRAAGVVGEVQIDGLGRFHLAPPDPPEVPAGEPLQDPDAAPQRRARLLRPRDTDDQEDG